MEIPNFRYFVPFCTRAIVPHFRQRQANGKSLLPVLVYVVPIAFFSFFSILSLAATKSNHQNRRRMPVLSVKHIGCQSRQFDLLHIEEKQIVNTEFNACQAAKDPQSLDRLIFFCHILCCVCLCRAEGRPAEGGMEKRQEQEKQDKQTAPPKAERKKDKYAVRRRRSGKRGEQYVHQ